MSEIVTIGRCTVCDEPAYVIARTGVCEPCTEQAAREALDALARYDSPRQPLESIMFALDGLNTREIL